MAYINFDETVPDDTETVSEFIDSTRENLIANRDAVILGVMPGWNWSITTPGAEPDEIIYSRGTERVKVEYTWSSGNVTYYECSYSANSGTLYEKMWSTNGRETITYDGSGFPSSGAWT